MGGDLDTAVYAVNPSCRAGARAELKAIFVFTLRASFDARLVCRCLVLSLPPRMDGYAIFSSVNMKSLTTPITIWSRRCSDECGKMNMFLVAAIWAGYDGVACRSCATFFSPYLVNSFISGFEETKKITKLDDEKATPLGCATVFINELEAGEEAGVIRPVLPV